MEAETGAYHELVEGVGDELVLLAQLKARVGAEEAVEELSGIREPDDGGHDVLHCAQVAHTCAVNRVLTNMSSRMLTASAVRDSVFPTARQTSGRLHITNSSLAVW